MELRDYVPDFVKEAIRDRLVVGVADAEAQYYLHAADEEALTGALGQSISRHPPERVTADGGDYLVRTYYRKIRGRGPGAPEKPLGADGIFQIDVEDANGEKIWSKGLPFQSKKKWAGTDSRLAEQSQTMIANAGQGLVVNYTPNGFKACPAESIVESGGSYGSLSATGQLRPLGQILGNEFLDCKIGLEGLYYDPDAEKFRRFGDVHIVGATVQRVRAPDGSS